MPQNDAASTDNNNNKRTAKLRHEAQQVSSILQAVQRRADELRHQQQTPTLGVKERDMLLQFNNSGMVQGIVGGVVSFVVLRRVRAALWQRIHNSSIQAPPHSSKPPTPPTSATSTRSSSNNNNPFQTNDATTGAPLSYSLRRPPTSELPQQSLFLRTFGLVMDSAMAFSLAVVTSIQCTDVKMILREMGQLPLLEGSSVVSQEFCPVILEELARLEDFQHEQQEQQQTDPPLDHDASFSLSIADHPPGHNKKTSWRENVESIYLRTILDFANNCELRQEYERRLRMEQGMDVNEPPFHTPIPPPGVPTDLWEDSWERQ